MRRILRGILTASLLFAVALLSVACTADPVGPGQSSLNTNAAAARQTRTYYIAADIVPWDYAPFGINKVAGQPFTPEESLFAAQDEDRTRIGRQYIKELYREYTDASFTTLKVRPPEWQHLGALGPLVRAEVDDTIRAEVDDTIRIVFRNNGSTVYRPPARRFLSEGFRRGPVRR